MDSVSPNKSAQSQNTSSSNSTPATPSSRSVAEFNAAMQSPQVGAEIGSSFPITNEKQAADDVLIQNPNSQESYWVSKGGAADAATAAALGTPLSPPESKPLTDSLDAANHFVDNYQNMRDANTIGADKYFHCKANCEAAQISGVGEGIAETISNGREWVDMNIKGDTQEASRADQQANHHGREQGKTNPDKPCVELCQPFRPNGLDPQY